MKYILYLIVPLLLLSLYGSCNNNSNNEGFDCAKIEDESNFLLDFQDCPAEGAIMICNTYTANLSQDDVLISQEFFSPLECNMFDCATIDCDLGSFTINMVLENSNFNGVFVDDNEEEFNFDAIPIVP